MRADKQTVTRLLKTARGQLDGILAMVENDRYCVDISNQVMATPVHPHQGEQRDLKSAYRRLRAGGV